VPFGRAGIGHRLDDLVFRGERRSPPLGLAAHGPVCIAPGGAPVTRRSRRHCKSVADAAMSRLAWFPRDRNGRQFIRHGNPLNDTGTARTLMSIELPAPALNPHNKAADHHGMTISP